MPRPQKTNWSMPAAVVIDLQSLCGLQTARILAGHGIPVFATTQRPKHPHCHTNVCQKIVFADSRSESLLMAL